MSQTVPFQANCLTPVDLTRKRLFFIAGICLPSLTTLPFGRKNKRPSRLSLSQLAWWTWTLMVLSTSSQAIAGPASNPVSALEFEQDLARIVTELNDGVAFNRVSCADYITRNTHFLLERGAETYTPRTTAELQRLRQQAPGLLRELLQLRLNLADRLRTFRRDGTVDNACVDAIRRAFRYSRFIEELIAELIVVERRQYLPSTPLQGQAPSLMLNPLYRSLELRSGDVLMVRSPSFISATIARIGDEDGQFSHLSMVYVADDGSQYVIEALIESGVVIVPLDEWLTEQRHRLLVLRHSNPQLAEKAARDLHTMVRARESAGQTIAYDYAMDLADHSEVFCAELIGLAYEQASSGELELPAYPTSLAILKGHPFLNNLGIRSLSTFAPGDLEVDPEFTLVAEWRDLRHTAESRIQDAILSSILEWMASRNYRLTHHGLFWFDMYWAVLRPFGVGTEELPENAKKPFVKSVLALETVAKLIYEEVAPSLLAKLEQDPMALDYKAILKAVETYRIRDCELLATYRRWQQDNPLPVDFEQEPPLPQLHRLITAPGESSCR